MVPRDIREFIKVLERTGDLVRIGEEIDWDLEVGAISRRACELNAPAALFERIKDYPEGYRILANPVATWRRVAIAMGLSPEASVSEIHRIYEQRIEHPIKPFVIKSWPHKRNVMLDEDIDLYRFPSPMCHELDGGRYIGTWDLVACQDPDSEWTNWGMYRFMIHNRRFLVGLPFPASHLGTLLREKFLPAGRPMPVAVATGIDPLCGLVATSGYRPGESEVDFAGGLRQKAVELVKCESNEVLVPANAEIVIEGEILPDATAPEGPFGEYTGYRHEADLTGVLVRVTAITYRDSPIMTMSNMGVPTDDSSVVGALGVAVALKRRLLRHGIPVTHVFLPPQGTSHLVVVGVRSGGREVAKQVLDVLIGRRAWYTKIMVVDDDVDVFDLQQVLHAFSVKCHSSRGIFLSQREGVGSIATPCYSREERGKQLGAVALFDCTWPSEWPRDEIPRRMSFEDAYPREIKDRVLAKWDTYSFKKHREKLQ